MGQLLNSASNIKSQYNIFVQPDEPETKEGIWVKTDTSMKIDEIITTFLGKSSFVPNTNVTIPAARFTDQGKIVMRHKDGNGNDFLYFFNDYNYASYPLQKYNFIDNTVTNFTNTTPSDLVSTPVRAVVYYSDKLYFFNTTASYSFDFATETFTNLNFVLENTYIKYGYAIVENCVYMIGYDGICYKYNLDALTLSQFDTGITNTGYINKVFPCGTDIYVICATDTGNYTASWAGYVLDTKTDTVIQLDMTDSIFFKTSTALQELVNMFPMMDKIGVITTSGNDYTSLTTFNQRDFSKHLYSKHFIAELTSSTQSMYLPFKNGAIARGANESFYFCGARTDILPLMNYSASFPVVHYFYNGEIYGFMSQAFNMHPTKIGIDDIKEEGVNKLIILEGGFTPIKLIKKSNLTFLFGGCILYEGTNVINENSLYIGDGHSWIKFENDFPQLQIVGIH